MFCPALYLYIIFYLNGLEFLKLRNSKTARIITFEKTYQAAFFQESRDIIRKGWSLPYVQIPQQNRISML